MTPTDNRQPIETRRFDRVHVAIWRNEAADDKGDGAFFSASFSRSVRGEDGAWRNVTSFTARDLPHLALAVDWAMRELLLKAD
ncbi:MAG: hypothetical protein H6819_07045 [Phycisphaerales bacterium]|nr:hypothetical protein [Phycisphaerales bacterium]MCB9855338.1 hypothetical protein [Phycisphaerales bacterium]MCB9862931.1 hypothetical protein [Phycisphaerales bacterium]